MSLVNSEYDVVIAGAGPAGATCALALKDAGLKVLLIDKSNFPRDKVCGDAIPLRAFKTLKSINQEYAKKFEEFPGKLKTQSTAVVYKGKRIKFDWIGEAFTSARIDFDNFLFSLVRTTSEIEIQTGILINSISRKAGKLDLLLSDGLNLTTKLLIGADGAHSKVASLLTKNILNREHHAASVRAYYSGIEGMDNNVMEIFFEKKFLPSYLWIFPVAGNRANVGFGILSSEIAKKRIDLKKAFQEFIDQVPELKQRFKNATLMGPVQGFGLPLGSGQTTISGDNFMLVGDAASLIDPLTGEGIGNAMLSGKLAAEQAIKCVNENNYSSVFMNQYDRSLLNIIGSELKARYRTQKLLSIYPAMLDLLFLAAKNKKLKNLFQKTF